MQKVTDEDIRMDYLVDSGFPMKDARQWIQDHPKPAMFGEAVAVLAQRRKELNDAAFNDPEWKRLSPIKKLWYRLRMRVGR